MHYSNIYNNSTHKFAQVYWNLIIRTINSFRLICHAVYIKTLLDGEYKVKPSAQTIQSNKNTFLSVIPYIYVFLKLGVPMIIFYTPIAWYWYFYNSFSYFLVYWTLEFYIPEDGHLTCTKSMCIYKLISFTGTMTNIIQAPKTLLRAVSLNNPYENQLFLHNVVLWSVTHVAEENCVIFRHTGNTVVALHLYIQQVLVIHVPGMNFHPHPTPQWWKNM